MSLTKPSCLVIGAGGVGVITALSLFKNNQSIVSLVARSDYKTVLNKGYDIDCCNHGKITGWKPHHTFQSVNDAINFKNFFDYIFVTTKNIPDGPAPVSSIIKPIIESNDLLWQKHSNLKHKSTNVVLIQNGFGIEKEIMDGLKIDLRGRTDLPNISLLSGVSLLASTKTADCKITQKHKDHLTIGAFDNENKAAMQAVNDLASLYSNKGENHVEIDADVKKTRWKKLLYNATVNPLTAILGLDYSRCLAFGTPEGSTELELIKPAMLEIVDLAKKIDNVTIEPDLVQFFLDCTSTLVYKPSMCVDADKGQLTEVEVILGNIVRLAKQHSISVPHLTMFYNIMRILQGKIKEQRGLLEFDETTAKIVNQ